MTDLSRLFQAILTGDAGAASSATRDALTAGIDPQEIVTRYMIPVMDEVGRRYEAGEAFVPELLISARAMKAAFALLRPLLTERSAESAGRVVIGTVKGDLHDIGKNLVASLLEGGGFEVTDLGVDVSPERFAQVAQERSADLVCLSALLTTTMPGMRTTIEVLTAAGLRDRVKVMVGGAPVTPAFVQKIGADAYGESASAAVAAARELVGRKKTP